MKILQNNFKTIFFDVDDTLFDREQAQREMANIIYQEYFEIFGEIDRENVINAYFASDLLAENEFNNLPAGESYEAARIDRNRKFLHILGLNENYAKSITELYVNVYPRINMPIKSSKEVIFSLNDKFQLGVISNGLADVQYQKLRTIGILDLLKTIVLSEEIGIRKPAPKIFQHAALLSGSKVEECLHVGDSYSNDVIGAKNAGMKTCWFNSHSKLINNDGILPDLEISKLADLLPILLK